MRDILENSSRPSLERVCSLADQDAPLVRDAHDHFDLIVRALIYYLRDSETMLFHEQDNLTDRIRVVIDANVPLPFVEIRVGAIPNEKFIAKAFTD